jgi:AcrR family transcriptional regulator
MSRTTTTPKASDKRGYRLGKRALQQEETRRRIIEAAVDLHCTVGPAYTTISQIAKRAGVQRHTYYVHFPDERSLFLACSALAMERGPLPDFGQLRNVPPGRDCLRRGIELLYDWYEQNADHIGCVVRDAQHHQLTREMVELRIAPALREAEEVIGENLDERSRALLGVALDFACWKRLNQDHSPTEAADLMSEAIACLAK